MDNPSEKLGREDHLPTVSRRTFLEVTAGLFTAYSGTAVAGQAGEGRVVTPSAEWKEFETPLCTLRLDSTTGNLCGITWKDPKLEVIQEPRLGENFRLRFPRPGYEANYFLSSQQKVSRIEEQPDGVTCHYDSLRNAREEINVKVRLSPSRRREAGWNFPWKSKTPRSCPWQRFSSASSEAKAV